MQGQEKLGLLRKEFEFLINTEKHQTVKKIVFKRYGMWEGTL